MLKLVFHFIDMQNNSMFEKRREEMNSLGKNFIQCLVIAIMTAMISAMICTHIKAVAGIKTSEVMQTVETSTP